MATKTSNYEFNKPEQNDFYDVDVQNENWDKVDEELSEFDDSGVTEDIKSFPDFLSKFVTGNKVAITLRNLKAGLQFVLHAGQIVNNCVTDNTGLPLSAAQGKALKDLIDTTNNNLSNTNSRLDTSLSSSVLDYALTLPEGLHAVQFPGTGYTGTDLPKSSYMYSSATISVRSTGKIATVLLFGISKNCPLAVNSCEDRKWKGWDQYVTKNDFVIKTYTIAGKAVNAETTADFEPNIALSGYTPLGIVGTRLNAYGSVTLVYADLVDDTKARVRVRNNGTESVTGDNVIIRVLYFKS